MNRQRGSIFVVSLAILAGLVAILASVAATHELFMTAESTRIAQQEAKTMAESGVQYALESLYEQQQTSGSNTNTNTGGQAGITAGAGTTPASSNSTSGATTLQDDWAQLGENGASSFQVGNTTFRMQIVDMCSRLNLNTATEEQLNRLPLTQEQVDSLLDFRTAGETARQDGGKDSYYNGLDQPYNAKLRNLDTFDELLQIKGFTPQVLYEPQTDTNSQVSVGGSNDQQPVLADLCTVYSFSPGTNAQGQQLVNLSVAGNPATKIQSLITAGVSANAATMVATRTFTSLSEALTQTPGLSITDQKAILNNCTTSAGTRIPGKININTATESVLLSIPNMTDDIAQAIVNEQSTGFAELGDILDVSGISGQNLSMVDYFTVSSQTFLVRVVGQSGGVSYPLEAIIDIQNGMPKIIMMQQPPYSDYLIRWGWDDDTTDSTVLTSSSS